MNPAVICALMPETVARIAPLFLALAFAWAAVAKLSGFGRWRTALAGYGLPSAIEPATALLVPFAEMAVAFVTIAVSVRSGAVTAAVMLALFSLAILRARSVKGDRLPCGCFGGSTERHYSAMLMRNAALGVAAAISLFGSGGPGGAVDSMPEGTDVLPATLVLAGLALVGWVAVQTSRSLQRRSDR
jgi:hypothetical protein